MNEFHDMLRGASDAAGHGAAADGAERASIRRRVGAGRRRRTMGTAAAALAGVLVVGATTLALASGGSRDAGPAASTSTPSPTAASSQSESDGVLTFGDSSLEGVPVSMDLAGGGTVEFASWSNEQFAETGIDILDVRPALDPVPAADLEGYGEGWAFVEDEITDDQGAAASSVLLLASPDGSVVEAADLVALADELGLGGGLYVQQVASSTESPQAMVVLFGDAGTAIVWMDLASGDTWAFSLGEGVYVEAISWRSETEWLAWGYADDTPLAFGLSVTGGAAALGVDDAWVPWTKGMTVRQAVYTQPGLVVLYDVAEDTTVLVNRDDTVYVVEGTWGNVIGRSGDCYLIEYQNLLGAESEDGIGCVDVATGEVLAAEDLPAPSGGSGLASLGNGYLEGPAFESGGTTAVWYRPSGDTEIEVDPDASVGYGGNGDLVWLDQDAVGVIGTDAVYRGIDLPLDDGGRDHAAYAYPVG
ncbi:hypothetical protein [Demequina sp. NBRC 110054]|uniref:hypothetical protein n=1 Tax=Demequina sp. NBRC 110054 TaxID=1570343 RepID=UPI0009FF7CCB|nr:hypothetical protein [Demequina sp. NBRC 110054]